jgi:hypothetical protein
MTFLAHDRQFRAGHRSAKFTFLRADVPVLPDASLVRAEVPFRAPSAVGVLGSDDLHSSTRLVARPRLLSIRTPAVLRPTID